MVCRLCLIEADENIVIFSEEKIQKYIAKFLQLEISPEDQISKVICGRCWHQLDNFQNFCWKIEQAQKNLNSFIEGSQQKLEISIPAEEEDFNVFKEDVPEPDDETFFEQETHITASEDCHELINAVKPIDSPPPEANENVTSRRITRQSTLQKFEFKHIPKIESESQPEPEPEPKRKRGRPKREEIKFEQENPPQVDEEEEDDEKHELNKEDFDSNAKRKRGRPKKGDIVTPKVKRPRSEQCSKMMQTAREFDAIIQKHMNLSCNLCSVRLVDFAELKRHFRAVHQRRGYAVCCNKRLFKRGLVVDHINVHNNPEYFKCTKCGKILADRMCLRNHDLLFHQKEELKIFQCAYCPKKYAKQYLLDHHSVKHVPQDECTFFCAECGKGYPTNSTLTKHINQIHSTVYDKMCEICAKLIRGKANFERHMEEHEGIVQPQVQCTLCDSWLKDKNSLRKHMYKHDGKTYTCNICDKVAPTKSALQSHKRYVHQLSRIFQCTYCEKSFKKNVNLKEHMTTHTGEVLYTCPHCPKTFNSKANMHSHRKKKHREEWEANRRYPKKEMKIEIT